VAALLHVVYCCIVYYDLTFLVAFCLHSRSCCRTLDCTY